MIQPLSLNVLDPLSPAEYESLKANIESDGQIIPILLDEDGMVIDGHHRLRVCQELGIEPLYERRTDLGNLLQKRALARALNLARRHLSSADKRRIIADQLKETVDWSNRRVASLIGVDDKTVAAVREELLLRNKIAAPVKTFGLDGKAYPVAKTNEQVRKQIYQQTADKRQEQAKRATELAEQVSRVGKPPTTLPPAPPQASLKFIQEHVYDLHGFKVDMIFTEPDAGVPPFVALAALAMRVLKPGGYLVSYCDQWCIAGAMAALEQQQLEFVWIAGAATTGAPRTCGKITSHFRPILIYGRSPVIVKPFVDTFITKWEDDWDLGVARHFLRALSHGDDMILDPYLRSGTTAVVALELQRGFIGSDPRLEVIDATKQRLGL